MTEPLDIDAAGKAAFEWDQVNEGAAKWESQDDGVKSWYREIASVVLAAADVPALVARVRELETALRYICQPTMGFPGSDETRVEAAAEAFQDCWNDFCIDTGDHPNFLWTESHNGHNLLALDTRAGDFDRFMEAALRAADAVVVRRSDFLKRAAGTFGSSGYIMFVPDERGGSRTGGPAVSYVEARAAEDPSSVSSGDTTT